MRLYTKILAALVALTLWGQCRAARAGDVDAVFRVWVSEAGWSRHADHAGVTSVLWRRAGRYGGPPSLETSARRFSRRTQPGWDGDRSARLEWVSQLDAACEPVTGFSWQPYRSICLELREVVARYLEGIVRWRCVGGLPDTWGGPMDEPDPRLVELDLACRVGGVWQGTRNRFYCDPAMRPCPNTCSDDLEFATPWEAARS